MPSRPFEVFRVGDFAVVKFWENAEKQESPETERWRADEYQLTVPWRSGLEVSIASNYQAWMALAIAYEGAAPPPSVEERVAEVENKTATIEETLDVLFGGAV
jgi:hypothetical protein